jgi:hypothetical protein
MQEHPTQFIFGRGNVSQEEVEPPAETDEPAGENNTAAA